MKQEERNERNTRNEMSCWETKDRKGIVFNCACVSLVLSLYSYSVSKSLGENGIEKCGVRGNREGDWKGERVRK